MRSKMTLRDITLFFVLSIKSELLILNQQETKNLPVLFDWSGQNETSEFVKNFKNPTNLQIPKWSCSAVLNGQMYIFGGLPDDGRWYDN